MSKGIANKLTTLLATKINYLGEFNTLFFVDKEPNGLHIKFLNKQHHDFILDKLGEKVKEIVGDWVTISHLNLDTDAISLKQSVDAIQKVTVIKPAPIKKKEKIELPTSRNKVIKEIEDFMSNEYYKIMDEQKEIRKEVDDYIHDSTYGFNYGRVSFMARLNSFLQKIKDYQD